MNFKNLKYFILFSLLLLVQLLNAQDKISHRLTTLDQDNNPLANVAIQIFFNEDESIGGFSDSIGIFEFESEKTGTFKIQLYFIGYASQAESILLSTDKTNHVFTLKSESLVLDEVTVKAMKEVIQREDDKLILSIDGKNTLGSNAIEILENAPGIQFINNNLSFLDAQVQIQIDGKLTRLRGNQLINFLKSKNAEKLKSIELIANPDASYAGNFDGRVINILTNKRAGDGYNASVYSTLNQRSVHLSKSLGLDVNIRSGKYNLYFNTGYYDSKRREQTDILQLINRASQVEIDENNSRNFSGKGPSYEVGLDYYFSEKSILGFKYEGYDDRSFNTLDGFSTIKTNGYLDSIVDIEDVKRENQNLDNVNLNFKTELKSKVSLNFDIDYGQIKNNFSNDQDQLAKTSAGEALSSNNRTQNVLSGNTLFGAKIDMSKKIGKAKLTTGVQYSLLKIDQDLNETIPINGAPTNFNDELFYNEEILSAYVGWKSKIKNINYYLGLRGEHTFYEGDALFSTNKVSDRYFNLFPQISVNTRVKKKHYFSLSYKRKIRRPRFNQLIPFKRYVSAFYYYIGNPNLRAYFPSTVELYYSYNNSFYTNIRYGWAKNRILEFGQLLENTNIIEGVKENNGSYESLAITVGYNKRFKPWFYLSSNFKYTIGSQRATFNQVEQEFNYDAYTFYISPKFKVNKNLDFSMNVYYSSDVYYNVNQNLSYWYFNSTIKYRILNGNGDIGFTIRDLFLTGITRSIAIYGDINQSRSNNWDSRQFILDFAYYFGDDKVKKKRRRSKTANDGTINRL